MATNQFKPFATRPDANVTPQNEWENLPALLSGFAGGKASSAQVNKALRQTSFIAAALAQFVSDKSGQDVLDDGDIAAFLAKLTTGFGKQYLSRQNPFADIKADGAAAVSSALANLGLEEAAKRGVGTGVGQIPDMNVFSYGKNWFKLPSGHIIQFAYCTAGTGIRDSWPITNYPIPFPTEIICPPIITHSGPGAAAVDINVIADTMGSLTSFRAGCNVPIPQTCAYIAIGK